MGVVVGLGGRRWRVTSPLLGMLPRLGNEPVHAFPPPPRQELSSLKPRKSSNTPYCLLVRGLRYSLLWDLV